MPDSIKQIFALHDVKFFWIMFLFIFLYLKFGEINAPEFKIPVIVSLGAAGIALHSCRYKWTSFVTIFVIGHVLQFSIATILVMSLEHPSLAIEPDIWETTHLGLWAMSLGMVGVACGVFLSRLNIFYKKIAPADKIIITPFNYNLFLTSLIVIVVIINIKFNIYYHKDVAGIEAYDFSAASSLGFVGYLTYIAYFGVILQMNNLIANESRLELIKLLLVVLIPTISLMPSGSRSAAMIFPILAAIFFLEYHKSIITKYIVIICMVTLLSLTTMIMGSYRVLASTDTTDSFIARTKLVIVNTLKIKFGTDSNEERVGSELAKISIARRLSDVQSVSHLIKNVPDFFDHRGFDDIILFPVFILPTLIRPDVGLELNYDANLMMDKYSFRPDIGGSSPMMAIGEAYERFGWFGIFFCMLIYGLILSELDKYLCGRSFYKMALWSFSFYTLLNLHAMSMLKFFIFMTKQMLIFLIMIQILVWIYDKHFNKALIISTNAKK